MRLTRRSLRQTGGLALSLTSMIDVVFLLLIFFLTTTSFVQPEQDLDTAISTRDSSADDARTELEPAVVTLARNEGQTLIRFGAVTTTDLSRIAEMLNGFSNKAPGAFVEVGEGVPFGDAARAMSVCRAAGFQPVTWLAPGKEGR